MTEISGILRDRNFYKGLLIRAVAMLAAGAATTFLMSSIAPAHFVSIVTGIFIYMFFLDLFALNDGDDEGKDV